MLKNVHSHRNISACDSTETHSEKRYPPLRNLNEEAGQIRI